MQSKNFQTKIQGCVNTFFFLFIAMVVNMTHEALEQGDLLSGMFALKTLVACTYIEVKSVGKWNMKKAQIKLKSLKVTIEYTVDFVVNLIMGLNPNGILKRCMIILPYQIIICKVWSHPHHISNGSFCAFGLPSTQK